MIVTVQTVSGRVEVDRTNGSSQSRYQGYITGAHKSDADMGQAKASADNSLDLRVIQMAVSKPTSAASAATTCGATSNSSAENRGSLKRNLCTYVASEPKGMRPWSRNGTYRLPQTTAASKPSRTRTRLQ